MPKTTQTTEAIKAIKAIQAIEVAKAREAIKAIRAIQTATTIRAQEAIKAAKAPAAPKVPKGPVAYKRPAPTEGTSKVQKSAPVVDRLLTQLSKAKHPLGAADLVAALQCSMPSVSLALRKLQGQGVVGKVRNGRHVGYTLV